MTRDEVFAALHQALRDRAPTPTGPLDPWDPPQRPDEDPVQRFIQAAQRVDAEVTVLERGLQAALETLSQGFDALCIAPDMVLTDPLRPLVSVETAALRPATTLGVARAVWAIAESGSVILETDGAHAPSLVTETSLIIVPRERLVARLEDVPPPTAATRARIIVTGPSRTADIEKKLVLGAHGPRRLLLYLVASPDSAPALRPDPVP